MIQIFVFYSQIYLFPGHQTMKAFLLVFLIISTLLRKHIYAASGGGRKDKDKIKNKFKTSLNRNPCKIEEHDAPIHCFCDGNGYPANATTAECWIFSKDLTKDYSIWSYFSSQPRIKEMKIIVRPHGQITFIPTKALVYLRELTKFSITYANIDDIHPYAFANLSRLAELKLIRNQIINLSHHAFAHLHNLTELNLDENRIAELKRDVFVDLPKLERLYITQNNLSVLQEGTFKYLSNLVELELNQNYISVLTKDMFMGLSELKRLDLNSNKISMLGDLTFAELWDLEVSLRFTFVCLFLWCMQINEVIMEFDVAFVFLFGLRLKTFELVIN